jgi:hypothetical protein
LLYEIKGYFGVGNIIKGKDMAYFAVTNKKDRRARSARRSSPEEGADLINVIIPHFMKYPLLTQKRADFELYFFFIIMPPFSFSPPFKGGGKEGGKIKKKIQGVELVNMKRH